MLGQCGHTQRIGFSRCTAGGQTVDVHLNLAVCYSGGGKRLNNCLAILNRITERLCIRCCIRHFDHRLALARRRIIQCIDNRQRPYIKGQFRRVALAGSGLRDETQFIRAGIHSGDIQVERRTRYVLVGYRLNEYSCFEHAVLILRSIGLTINDCSTCLVVALALYRGYASRRLRIDSEGLNDRQTIAALCRYRLCTQGVSTCSPTAGVNRERSRYVECLLGGNLAVNSPLDLCCIHRRVRHNEALDRMTLCRDVRNGQRRHIVHLQRGIQGVLTTVFGLSYQHECISSVSQCRRVETDCTTAACRNSNVRGGDSRMFNQAITILRSTGHREVERCVIIFLTDSYRRRQSRYLWQRVDGECTTDLSTCTTVTDICCRLLDSIGACRKGIRQFNQVMRLHRAATRNIFLAFQPQHPTLLHCIEDSIGKRGGVVNLYVLSYAGTIDMRHGDSSRSVQHNYQFCIVACNTAVLRLNSIDGDGVIARYLQIQFAY